MATTFASIAHKDRQELVRDSRLRLAVLLVLLLSLAAVAATFVRVSEAKRDRAAATATEHHSWLNQGPRDPHAAAHFSQWVFRPVEGAALLDPGATPYAGSAIWLEAHHRNPAAYRPVEDRTTTLDLGEFSPSWVLQTLGPLLVFLLAAGLVARERESGTLRLMIASGASPSRLVVEKARGLFATIMFAAIPVFVAAALAVALAPSDNLGDTLLRSLLWALAHMIWLAIAVLIGVAVSARVQSTGRALVILISLWIIAVPLMPRAAASIAEALDPTPSGAQFVAKIGEETREGVEGVLPSGKERSAALKADLLRRYNVKDTDDLPISFRGASLKAGEAASAKIYARNYVMLDDIYAEQRRTMRIGALISPLIAVQNISAAFAGTDDLHLRSFDNQAEAERMRVVQAMNDDVKRHGAGNPNYKADERLWQQFGVFKPQGLSLGAVFRNIWPDLLILFGWLIGSVLLLRAAGQRLVKEMTR